MTKYKDPFKDLRVSLALMSDPLKEYRDLMASISDPLREFRASMELISDPLKEHREMMASISDPLREFRASMELISDPLKEHRDLMASISDPLREFRASLELMSDPLKEHREVLASISDPLREFRAYFTPNSDPLEEIRNAISQSVSLEWLRNIAHEVESDIEIDSEGVATLASKSIAATDLQEMSGEIFHIASQAQSRSIAESIDNLAAVIEAQKDPLAQKILIYFVYPLIILLIASIVNPVVDYHVTSQLRSDKRVQAKELKATVSSAIDDKEILNSLRYVSADSLNVRASPSANAKTIASLHFASTVLIIEKQKSWTLVEWNNPESDAKITGWVFSRYLAKFR